MDDSRSRGWVVLVAILALVAAVGAMLVWVAWTRTSAPHDDFWIQVGGAGLQVGLVSVIGTILAGTLAWLDSRRQREEDDRKEHQKRLEAERDRAATELEREREKRHRLDEVRLRIFDDLVAGYNQVKAVRRNLRALGLRQPPEKLSGGQVDGLRAQMMQLVEAQLSLEALWRELNTNSGAFNDPGSMLSQIRTVEKYLHAIIKEWENAGGGVWADEPGTRVSDLMRLQPFIGEKKDFKEQASTPLRAVQGLVRQELMGSELGTLENEDETDD